MTTESWQQCIVPSCGKKYSVKERRTTCDCGELLDVKYRGDYPKSLQDTFRERRNHKQNIFDESGVWRYRELINFVGMETENYGAYSKKLVSLDGAEGRTKPFHLTKVADYVGLKTGNFWLQFEGDNPTGSFKDNGMATAFTHARMVGAKKVVCASTGNTSSSAAAFAANELDMEAVIFVGAGKIAKGKLAQTLAYGAKVLQVKGDFDVAMAMVKELSKRSGIYVVNSLNAFRLEGQKTMMYRMLDYLNWKVPDWVCTPIGGGGLISELWQGFKEFYEIGLINSLPKLAGFQSGGFQQVAWAFQQNLKSVEPVYEHLQETSFAYSLDGEEALQSVRESNGLADILSKEQVIEAQKLLAKNEGILAESMGVWGYAGLLKCFNEKKFDNDEVVVVTITGQNADYSSLLKNDHIFELISLDDLVKVDK